MLFFYLIVEKCQINRIPKWAPFRLEMFKIASDSGAEGAYDAPPDPLVVWGFLPSAIAVSRLRRLIPL